MPRPHQVPPEVLRVAPGEKNLEKGRLAERRRRVERFASVSNFHALLAVVSLSAAAPVALAQLDGSSNSASAAPSAQTANDAAAVDPTAFVKSAAMGGLAQIQLAKLALAKTENADIRAFADRLSKDHLKARAELTKLAKEKGFDVPESLVGPDETLLEEAAQKSGSEFDSWFVGHMKLEQEKSVALFSSATNSADAQLAAFAKRMLPILQGHQQMADALPGA